MSLAERYKEGWKEEGRKEGREEGRKEGRKEIIREILLRHSPKEIADFCGYSLEELLAANNPKYV